MRDIGEAFNGLGFSWENVRFTGGGSKNPVWRQIVAEILGKPLTGVCSDSVLGVAIIAAVASGAHPSIRQAVSAMVHETFRVEPDAARVETYRRLYDQFSKIKPVLDQLLMKDLSCPGT